VKAFWVVKPVWERTNVPCRQEGERPIFYERVGRWEIIGEADTTQEARAKYAPVAFGYSVVLQPKDDNLH
jgi:hypothetical protein